jgi:hypothetical protein
MARRDRDVLPLSKVISPPTKPQADGVLVKALARACRWQKLLDRGVYGSVIESAPVLAFSNSSWHTRRPLVGDAK